MRVNTFITQGLLGTLSEVFTTSPTTTTVTVNGHRYHVDQVLTRDVAIIGGGSAGTYSAIRLHDLGKSVVVVEGTDRLGGHTQTYTDPNTGATIDYGVQVWHPFDIVENYFNRLGVGFQVQPSSGIPGVTALNMDFSTGKLDLAFPSGNFTAALVQWTDLVLKFPYLDYGFDLPSPIPEDLLMNFGDFAKKYALDALFPYAYFFTQGVGDILNQPTLYVMKSFGINDIINLQTGFLTTTSHDNSLLYLAAQGVLGPNVLYNSTILDVERSNNSTQAIISTNEKKILIKANKLIIAIQPTLGNLKHFDLTHQEKHMFSQWKWSQYCTGLIKNSGIPDNTTLNNIAPGKVFQVPPPPSLYQIGQTGVPGIQVVYYIDTHSTSDATIQKNMLDIVKSADVPGKTASDPEFLVYSNHKPFTLWVGNETIKHGFYEDLYSLQGKRNSWYISASMHTHDSSLIWRYAEGLLGNITAY